MTETKPKPKSNPYENIRHQRHAMGDSTKKQSWLMDAFSWLKPGLDWLDKNFMPWFNGNRFIPNAPGQYERTYSAMDKMVRDEADSQIAAEKAFSTNLARLGKGLSEPGTLTSGFNAAGGNTGQATAELGNTPSHNPGKTS